MSGSGSRFPALAGFPRLAGPEGNERHRRSRGAAGARGLGLQRRVRGTGPGRRGQGPGWQGLRAVAGDWGRVGQPVPQGLGLQRRVLWRRPLGVEGWGLRGPGRLCGPKRAAVCVEGPSVASLAGRGGRGSPSPRRRPSRDGAFLSLTYVERPLARASGPRQEAGLRHRPGWKHRPCPAATQGGEWRRRFGPRAKSACRAGRRPER